MRNTIKAIWKSGMKKILRLYVGNPNLYVDNSPKNIQGRKDIYSQFGQDAYVFNIIFKGKRNGVFIDVGGNHPIKANNTYLLELHGWTGLAIEPQESLRKLWPAVRKTPCLNYVIGAENKEVTFAEGNADQHGLSGVEGFNKLTQDYTKITVQQKRLDDILSENKIAHVDYLSIDVEGYEMNVLESIDFSKTDIKVIGVENDIGFRSIPLIGKKIGSELGNNKLRKFLEDKGYRYIARIMCDDFFIKI